MPSHVCHVSQMNFWQIACLVRRHWKYFQIWRLFEICLFQIGSINLKLFQIISKFLKKFQLIASDCNKSRKIANYLNNSQFFAKTRKNLRFIVIICNYLQKIAILEFFNPRIDRRERGIYPTFLHPWHNHDLTIFVLILT